MRDYIVCKLPLYLSKFFRQIKIGLETAILGVLPEGQIDNIDKVLAPQRIKNCRSDSQRSLALGFQSILIEMWNSKYMWMMDERMIWRRWFL